MPSDTPLSEPILCRPRSGVAAAVSFLVICTGCGGPASTFIGTFTSEVVQRESCRRTDENPAELCTRDEMSMTLRVTLVEDEQQRIRLRGIARAGVNDRTLWGTLDSTDGYYFVDERRLRNEGTGCVLTESIELSLRIDAEADPEQVGVDECIALVGRETRKTVTSAECDAVNDPPKAMERVVRRRWQRAASCP